VQFRQKYILVLVSTSLILFLSCNEEEKLPEEKFIQVYVDLLILQDSTRIQPISLDSMKTIVFTKHNITLEQYDATINYYYSYPEQWEAFFDKAILYAEKLKGEGEKQTGISQ
jgi:hypothetical protein